VTEKSDPRLYQAYRCVKPLLILLLLASLALNAVRAASAAPAFDLAQAQGDGDTLAIASQLSDLLPTHAGPAQPPPDGTAWEARKLGIRTLGFSYKGFWVRSVLVNSAAQARSGWLVVSEPYTDYVDCFVDASSGPRRIYRMGDHRPFDARPIRDPGLLIPIEVAAQGQVVVQCLIRNNGSAAAAFRFWAPAQYALAERESAFFRALCYGALGFTVLLAIVLALINRNPLSFLVVAGLLPGLGATAGREGDAFQLLWPSHPAWNLPPYCWILIGVISATLVFRRIITPSEVEDWFIRVVVSSAALLLVSVLALPTWAPALSAMVQWLSVIYPVVLVLICANHWRDNAVAKVLGVGMVVQMVALLINVAGVFGVYRGHFALASLYASVVKALTLAAALFYRMRLDRHERARAQAEHTTELERRLGFEARLRHAVSHHPRYGMPNQAMLEEAVRAASVDASEGVAVWLIKLNRFGFLESILPPDTLSNMVKIYMAELGRWMAARMDVALLRIEGEHHLAALDDSTLAFVTMGVGHESLKADLPMFLTRRFEWQGLFVAWDPHIGVAVLKREQVDNASNFTDEARIALQWCSAHDRLRVFDAERMKREQLAYGLTLDLEGAIERGELLLHYQPKVTLQSRRTESLEALVRWHHPERGMIPPGAFIAEAEATGAINRLTMWAIAEAARFLLTLPDPTVRVSVNITAFDLATPHFVEQVLDTLRREGCPPCRLMLEVTESAALSDREHATRVLSSLREQGVRIALDDFGAGYSSLGILQEMPLDEMKVDRSFVTDIDDFGRKQAVLKAMIEVGHSLGLSVTIEGVEHAASLDWLSRHGCDVVQGFVFSRPLDAQAAQAWLRAEVQPAAMEPPQQPWPTAPELQAAPH
jgi:EAL domain-containing protein (putative c-di-GMP-specific phosphodiesterase class I)